MISSLIALALGALTMNGAIWGLVLFLATFIGSIAAVAFLLVQLPATYFLDSHHPWGWCLRWTALILKNLLGAVLVGVGVLMLFTPGQGVLTILIGVMLLNFPGKRRLERKLVGRPRVMEAINRLRARFGKAPLILEEGQDQPGTGGAEALGVVFQSNTCLESGTTATNRVSAHTQPPKASQYRGHERIDKALARRLLVGGHELKVFVESAPLIAAMIADIRDATTRVWLESYIFAGDSSGQAVAEALKERARAGVDVRVLYDAVGSFDTPSALFDVMQAAGVQVHAFHTLWEAFWQMSILRILNRRNHRKLLVIDDRVAYFGGMNIVHEMEQAQGEHLPKSTGCRDVHVRLVGPRQSELAENMDRLWRRLKKQPTKREPSSWRWPTISSQGENLHFFDSSPGFKYSRAARIFTQLIRRAKRTITISMAYFIPVGKILRELGRACQRGVLIQVIVPGQSDVPVVQRASRHCYTRLLRHGIHIFERQDKMVHGKVMIVDNQWTLVGSCNLDPRSLWINREFFAVIVSRKVAAVIRQVCAYEMEQSMRVTLADCRQRPWWQRLLDWAAWSFRWWL